MKFKFMPEYVCEFRDQKNASDPLATEGTGSFVVITIYILGTEPRPSARARSTAEPSLQPKDKLQF